MWLTALALALPATCVATAYAAPAVPAAASSAPKSPSEAEAAIRQQLKAADDVFNSGDHWRALAMMNEAVNQALARLGPSHELTLGAQIDQAATLYHLGELAEANARMKDVLERCMQSLGERHPSCLDALNNLANMTEVARGIKAALPMYERAYRLRLEVQGPEHEHSISALSDLGFGLMESGELHQALPLMQQALALRRRVQGDSHPYTYTAANNLAVLYERLARYTDARREQDWVLAARMKQLGERHPETLVSMNNLARLTSELEEKPGALALAQRAVAMMEEVLGPRHFNTLDARQNLAGYRADAGDAAQALQEYERVVEDRALAQSADHHRRLFALIRLADLLAAQGQTGQALVRLDEARAGIERTVGDRHPLAVSERVSRARILLRQGAADQAQQVAREAVPTAESLFGSRHEMVLELRTLEAAALARRGLTVAAHAAAVSLVQDIEASRQDSPSTDAVIRQRWLQRHRPAYLLAVELSLATGQTEAAHALVQRLRARNLHDRLDDRRLALAAGVPLADWQRLQEQREQVEALGKLLVRDQPAQTRQAMLEARARAQVQAARLAAELATRHPGYSQGQLVTFAQPSVAAASAGQPHSGPVPTQPGNASAAPAEIDFLVLDTQALGLAQNGARVGAFVRRPGAAIRWIDLGPADGLQATVQAFRLWTAQLGHRQPAAGGVAMRILRTESKAGDPRWDAVPATQSCNQPACEPSGARPVWGQAAWRELAAALGRKLLEPLHAEIGAARGWHISADPALAILPWDALIYRGRHVVERHAVTLVQGPGPAAGSPVAVSAPAAGQRPPTRPPSLWAIGDPAFGGLSPATTSTDPTLRRVRGQLRQADLPKALLDPQGRLTFEPGGWTRLPAARAELDASARAFEQQGGRATVLSGIRATESGLREAAARGDLAAARVLLFATHAFFNPGTPRHSALVLQPGAGGAEDDGYVTPDELIGLRLDADLTVLSACETAQGASTAADAAAGFAYALQIAGSRNNLLTLWPVTDGPTSRFVADLMRRMARGLSPDLALHETKRRFLRHENPSWRSARHWAAFGLYATR